MYVDPEYERGALVVILHNQHGGECLAKLVWHFHLVWSSGPLVDLIVVGVGSEWEV